MLQQTWDVIVIGGGHAGIEAARAASAAGDLRVCLITMDPSKIGEMSCNPAIGGLAKGQMVREIDALGGIMPLAADRSGIMFRMLNTSRGAAVRGPRCQNDKHAYAAHAQVLLAGCDVTVIAGTIDDICVNKGRVVGVRLPAGAGVVQARTVDVASFADTMPDRPFAGAVEDRLSEPCTLQGGAVVLTTGTFMRALMHTGEQQVAGGRVGEGVAAGIAGCLLGLGLELTRFKTGTPPRLSRASLDWDSLPEQFGDESPVRFSDRTAAASFPMLPQVCCRVTNTTAEAHALIRDNLHRAPMYAGAMTAVCGPRYCPSIEDKVVRFADRDQHHVFLEPESLHTDEVYCNGISTSLPPEVQIEIVRSMPGCERAQIIRPGYAVEYDLVQPCQLDATTMVKSIEGLFLAGQINGTSGYEEAAGQGLLAGLNAARRVRGDAPVRLGRDEAYIGVMLDDLVTRMPEEPYRMFTSRAEHRMRLRADNADERLTAIGRDWGLIDDEQWDQYRAQTEAIAALHQRFQTTKGEGGRVLAQLCRRPEMQLASVMAQLGGGDDPLLVERVMNDCRYAGYLVRQQAEIKRQREADGVSIPASLDPNAISGLRSEARDVLGRMRPATLGQASRLAGINPADVTVLRVALDRMPKPGRPEGTSASVEAG
ncbi:MAG: tRNA uridine-5-carboxymethylaminomethyl(34) synthesis enzyme MnmG [Phycisphaerales bacterium]|nr:tRNA uridine-5-carboxymethylaminomethyl(34) synthesis enzyme MnmG [Phycisphaerales bacterium]